MTTLRKLATNLLRSFRPDQPKVMGRWTIVYCPDKIKSRVDLTNEDHCGPCGQYGVQPLRVNPDKTIVERKEQ